MTPPVDAKLSDLEQRVIDDLREKCETLQGARDAQVRALDARDAGIQEAGPILERIGYRRVAREIGSDLIGEATIRQVAKRGAK